MIDVQIKNIWMLNGLKCLSVPTFLQFVSEQQSNCTELKWMDEAVCSQSGPVERHHRACPRKASPTTGTNGPLLQGAQNAPFLG